MQSCKRANAALCDGIAIRSWRRPSVECSVIPPADEGEMRRSPGERLTGTESIKEAVAKRCPRLCCVCQCLCSSPWLPWLSARSSVRAGPCVALHRLHSSEILCANVRVGDERYSQYSSCEAAVCSERGPSIPYRWNRGRPAERGFVMAQRDQQRDLG